ncbi:DUF2855 family protein [Variovorax paradoxus]|uniref:DUF2855 family protein n=1 Tax=Variovorax paradoxus TaxID=34073 RepID=UPI003ECFC6D0
MSTTTSFLVRKGELATTRLHTATDQPLADGQVRVRIDSFALTSNNITYAAFGDAMSYWQFFPSAEEGWGSIPVWGFASVVQSLHPGVAVGERLYGYWPMSSGAVLSPDRLSPARLTDAAAHRAELPAVYNQYFRCNAGLRNAIHTRFSNLKYSCSIGGTHVEQLAAKGAGKDLAGPRATLFFAPAQIKKRTAEWGADEFGRRMVAAWHHFLASVTDAKNPWLRAEHHHGGEAVQAAYAQVLAGKGDPRIGHVLSLYKQPGGL